MKAPPPGTMFRTLIGAGLLLAVLLVSGLVHALSASCHGSWGDIACLFLPTHDDISTHLLSYVLAGVIVGGAYRGFLVWRTQRKNLAFLTQHLTFLANPFPHCQAAMSVPRLRGKIDIVDCATPFCFCCGFISPRIYLSRGMMEKLTTEELEAVLLHEEYHLEKRDPLKMMFGCMFVSALFFAPVLKDMFQRYLAGRELAADRNAIRHQGHKRGIAGALYKMLKYGPVTPDVAVASSDYVIEARIDYILGGVSSKQHTLTALGLATSLLGTGFLIFATVAPLPTHSL